MNTFLFTRWMLADLSIVFLPLVVSNAASEHLNGLKTNSKQYFTSDFSSCAWIRNSFSVSIVPSMFSVQQYLEIQNGLRLTVMQICSFSAYFADFDAKRVIFELV